jgi:hypothetical protein
MGTLFVMCKDGDAVVYVPNSTFVQSGFVWRDNEPNIGPNNGPLYPQPPQPPGERFKMQMRG